MSTLFNLLAELDAAKTPAPVSRHPSQPVRTMHPVSSAQSLQQVTRIAPVQQGEYAGISPDAVPEGEQLDGLGFSTEGFSADGSAEEQHSARIQSEKEPAVRPSVNPAVQLLRSPGGLRKAMLLTEVLGTPVSRRQGRRF